MNTTLLGAGSVLLARVDDTDYLAVRAVYAVTGDDPPVLYCHESDWATMPMARIAELLRTNAALLARVAELESRPVVPESPLQNQERMFQRQAAALDPCPEGGKIPCDYPGCLDWIKPRGMHAHKRQAHGISITGARTPPETAMNERRKCPHCNARPRVVGMAEHIAREHAHAALIVAVPSQPVQFVEELGWHCAAKGCAGAHARDLHDTAFCTLHAALRTNGLAVT